MIIHQDHRHLRRLGPTLVLAIVGLAIVACGEQSGADSGAETSTPNSAEAVPDAIPVPIDSATTGSTATEDSTETPELVLRIGTNDREDQPSGQQVDEFARRVNEMSDGTIQIEPVFHAGDGGLDFDQRVIDRITSSDLDMGLIPTRAWDTEGVDSLRALNTPFLITSEAAVADVITSGIANDMMSGLDQAGVVGLALMPEALRHPYSFGDPLLAPADYDGAIVRTPISATVTEMFSALGATTTAEEPDINTQTGMESEYALQPTGTATGNVTFFPKVNSLVVNAARLEGLTPEQRTILQDAADDTRSWAIDALPSDAELAAAYCEQGATVVLASDEDLTALRNAVAPMIDELEQDPETARLIDEITAIQAGASDLTPEVEACEPDAATAGTSEEAAAVNGIYEFEITDDDLHAGGIDDPELLAYNHGTFTWTLDDGEWKFDQVGPDPESNFTDHGTYSVSGSQITFDFPSISATEIYNWTANPNGDLNLTAAKADPIGTVLMTAATWHRTGEVPD